MNPKKEPTTRAKEGSLDSPLYRVGKDRVLIDDVTRFGLHRKHIVRKGAMPRCKSMGEGFPEGDDLRQRGRRRRRAFVAVLEGMKHDDRNTNLDRCCESGQSK